MTKRRSVTSWHQIQSAGRSLSQFIRSSVPKRRKLRRFLINEGKRMFDLFHASNGAKDWPLHIYFRQNTGIIVCIILKGVKKGGDVPWSQMLSTAPGKVFVSQHSTTASLICGSFSLIVFTRQILTELVVSTGVLRYSNINTTLWGLWGWRITSIYFEGLNIIKQANSSLIQDI